MTDHVVSAGSDDRPTQPDAVSSRDAVSTGAASAVSTVVADSAVPVPVQRSAPTGHADRTPPRANRKTFKERWRRDWPLVVMVLPGILLLLVFHYLPTVGTVIAFQDYNPWVGDDPFQAFLKSQWIGFGNFEQLFASQAFWEALGNTLAITTFQLVFYFPLPIFIAILLNSVLSQRLRTFVQSVIYLPHFFSWVLVITFFVQMLGGAGLLAEQLRQAGLEPLNIMSNPDTFIFLVTAETVWKDVGWGTIVFLAALSMIDPNLYEAAAADGAGRWRRLWHITLPGLRPVIILLLILRLGDALNVGFEQFILQRDAVGRQAAEVIDTFVYYNAIATQQFGFGAAAGLFKAVVGITLVLIANKIAHWFGEQGVYSKS